VLDTAAAKSTSPTSINSQINQAANTKIKKAESQNNVIKFLPTQSVVAPVPSQPSSDVETIALAVGGAVIVGAMGWMAYKKGWFK
jgi:hypothetical protein